jgi:hypothetical protein
MKKISWLLAGEMFFEDIPQVILTYLVMTVRNGGEWSPVGVFNLTTSLFNFAFNILDMIMPLEEVHHDEDKETRLKEKQQQQQEKYQQHTGMAVEDDASQGGNSGGGNYYAPVLVVEQPIDSAQAPASSTGDANPPQEGGTADDHGEKGLAIAKSESTASVGFDQLKEQILSNNLQESICLPPPSDGGNMV